MLNSTGRRSKLFPIYIFLDFLFVLLNLSSLENIISTIRYKSYWKTTTCSLKKIFFQFFVTMEVCLGKKVSGYFKNCLFLFICSSLYQCFLYFNITISSITAQKMKDFVSTCEQIRCLLRICSLLLKKSLVFAAECWKGLK